MKMKKGQIRLRLIVVIIIIALILSLASYFLFFNKKPTSVIAGEVIKKEPKCMPVNCSKEGVYCEDVDYGSVFVYCRTGEDGCLNKKIIDQCGDEYCKCKDETTYSGGNMIDEVIIRDKQFYDSFGVLFKEGESFAYNQEGEEKICDILRIYTLEYSNVINAENSSIWASSVCRAKQGRCLFYIQLGYSEETDFPSWVYSCKTDYDCESHLGDIAEKYTLNTSGIISKGCILS